MGFALRTVGENIVFTCPTCKSTLYAVNLSVMCEYCQTILPDAEDILLDIAARYEYHNQDYILTEF